MPSNVTNPNSVVNPGAGRLPAATVPSSALLSEVGSGGSLVTTSFLYVNTLVLAPLFDSTGTLEIGTVTQLGLTMGRAASNTTINGLNVSVGASVTGTNSVTVGNAPTGQTTKTYVHGNQVDVGVDADTTTINVGTTVASTATIGIGSDAGTVTTSVLGSTVSVGTGATANTTVGSSATGTTAVRGQTINIGTTNTTTTLNVGTDLADTGKVYVGEATSLGTEAHLSGRLVHVGNSPNTTDIQIGTGTAANAIIQLGGAPNGGTVNLWLDGNEIDIGSDSDTTEIVIGSRLLQGVPTAIQIGPSQTDLIAYPTYDITTWLAGNTVVVGRQATLTTVAGVTIQIGTESHSNAVTIGRVTGNASDTTTTLTGDVVNISTEATANAVSIGTGSGVTAITVGSAASAGGALVTSVQGKTLNVGTDLNTAAVNVGRVNPGTLTTTTLTGDIVLISTEADANTVALGTGTGVTSIFIGNAATSTVALTTEVQGKTLNIGTDVNTSTVNVGTGNQGKTINIGTQGGTTAAITTNIEGREAINIGLAMKTSGVITIGNTATATSVTTLEGATVYVGGDAGAASTNTYVKGTTVDVGFGPSTTTNVRGTTINVGAGPSATVYLGGDATSSSTNTYVKGGTVAVDSSNTVITVGTVSASGVTIGRALNGGSTVSSVQGNTIYIGSDHYSGTVQLGTNSSLTVASRVHVNTDKFRVNLNGFLRANGSTSDVTAHEGGAIIFIGSSQTYTVPDGFNFVQVTALAGGGGGGSGAMLPSGYYAVGGGGGGGGGWARPLIPIPVSVIRNREIDITIGSGGNGGAAITRSGVTQNAGNGLAGSRGNNTTVRVTYNLDFGGTQTITVCEPDWGSGGEGALHAFNPSISTTSGGFGGYAFVDIGRYSGADGAGNSWDGNGSVPDGSGGGSSWWGSGGGGSGGGAKNVGTPTVRSFGGDGGIGQRAIPLNYITGGGATYPVYGGASGGDGGTGGFVNGTTVVNATAGADASFGGGGGGGGSMVTAPPYSVSSGKGGKGGDGFVVLFMW